MQKLLLFLIALIPLSANAQDYSLSVIYPKLEIKNQKLPIETNTDEKIDSIIKNFDTLFVSTGNPTENLSFQFLDAQTGFAYGNEQGYGLWPFLYKTTDGGNSWTKIFFKHREYGDAILKDNFYMFDKNKGILIHRYGKSLFDFMDDTKNKFYYWLTKDGGITWKKKHIKLKNKGLRFQNSEHFLMCEYSKEGEIIINILQAPWNAPTGKRELKDRKLVELRSTDFGKHFTEKNLR